VVERKTEKEERNGAPFFLKSIHLVCVVLLTCWWCFYKLFEICNDLPRDVVRLFVDMLGYMHIGDGNWGLCWGHAGVRNDSLGGWCQYFEKIAKIFELCRQSNCCVNISKSTSTQTGIFWSLTSCGHDHNIVNEKPNIKSSRNSNNTHACTRYRSTYNIFVRNYDCWQGEVNNK
jgi:hypothetical protein